MKPRARSMGVYRTNKYGSSNSPSHIAAMYCRQKAPQNISASLPPKKNLHQNPSRNTKSQNPHTEASIPWPQPRDRLLWRISQNVINSRPRREMRMADMRSWCGSEAIKWLVVVSGVKERTDKQSSPLLSSTPQSSQETKVAASDTSMCVVFWSD